MPGSSPRSEQPKGNRVFITHGRILDEHDLSAHILAYDAYCLLRDNLGVGDALRAVENKLGLREIPEFLKHADHYPDAILREHSPETSYITFTLAIRLWKDHGGEETEPMRPSRVGRTRTRRASSTLRRRRSSPAAARSAPSTISLQDRRPRNSNAGLGDGPKLQVFFVSARAKRRSALPGTGLSTCCYPKCYPRRKKIDRAVFSN